ncbi:MAG: hypothetical protein JO023_29075 [Chloroflexi bacterium]|nr:hypothetical protein [Chloroflexota bacterium]
MRHTRGKHMIWAAGVSLSLLLLAACQVLPGSSATTVSSVTVWGQVPKQCNCHLEPLARVGNDLQGSQLAVDFRLQQANTEGFQTFSVSFDPRQVSEAQIKQMLQNDGANIIPAPSS